AMFEVGGGLGLAPEALHVGLIGELAGEDHLQRDGPIEADLSGLVYDAHTAAGDLAEDLVIAKVTDAAAGRRLAVAAGRLRCDRCQLVLGYGARGSARTGAEDGFDHRGMPRKAGSVLGRRGIVAGAAAELALDAKQFTQ